MARKEVLRYRSEWAAKRAMRYWLKKYPGNDGRWYFYLSG